jgi:hypothetical protein
MNNTIITTKEQIQKVFAEWNRRYLETPEEFRPDAAYDEEAARVSAEYFVQLLHEVN